MKDPTFVTGFFDPAKLGRGSYRSASAYLRLFRELVTEVPFPIVAYVDSDLADEARRVVESARSDKPRVVISVPMDDLPHWRRRDALARELRPMKNAGLASEGPKDTLGFAIMTWSKPWLMRRAATEENVYGASHLAWIDFGIAHICDPGAEDVDWDAIARAMPPEICVCEMRATCPSEIEDLSDFYAYNRGKIASGFFTGSRESFVELARVFDEEIERMFDTGYYVLEEQIFGALTVRCPDLFRRWYSDYSGELANYTAIRRDAETVLDNLAYCRAKNFWERGLDIFDAVVVSATSRALRLWPVHVGRLLFEGQVCAYYVDRERARDVAELISLLYACGTNEMRKVFDRYQPQLAKNLAFSDVVPSRETRSSDWQRLARREDLHCWSSCL